MEIYFGRPTANDKGGRLAYRTGGGLSADADRPPKVSMLFGTLTFVSRLESRLNACVCLGGKAGFV